jgi:hypothetical protein
MRVAVVVGWVG